MTNSAGSAVSWFSTSWKPGERVSGRTGRGKWVKEKGWKLLTQRRVRDVSSPISAGSAVSWLPSSWKPGETGEPEDRQREEGEGKWIEIAYVEVGEGCELANLSRQRR